MGHVGFQESIPAIPFWNSKYPIPNRSLRAAVPSASSALHSDCIMPIPSLQMQKKVEKAYAEKQRVWSTELWSPRFVTMQVIVLSVVLLQTTANQ